MSSRHSTTYFPTKLMHPDVVSFPLGFSPPANSYRKMNNFATISDENLWFSVRPSSAFGSE